MNVILVNKETLIVENIIEIKDIEYAIKLFNKDYICVERVYGVNIGFVYDPISNTFSNPN